MKRTRTFFKVTFVIMVVVILINLFGMIYTSFNDHEYIATVTNKERIVETIDEKVVSYYLIFCKDDEENYYEFKNEDLFIRGKVNSSNIYNQLEEGKKYKITVVGFRVKLFSWYENIIKIEKID